jgi:hypothetical protein
LTEQSATAITDTGKYRRYGEHSLWIAMVAILRRGILDLAFSVERPGRTK